MAWENLYFDKAEDLFGKLPGLCNSEYPLVCRGQADSEWPLKSSLDRILNPKSDYRERLGKEEAILESFCIQTREFFGPVERLRLDERSKHKMSAFTVLQHYRAPTRLLDWTRSLWVALYFAVINHPEKKMVQFGGLNIKHLRTRSMNGGQVWDTRIEKGKRK